jgi:CHAD domain-containing protein
MNTADRVETLESQIETVLPQDTMAEAGRKALLNELVKMLKHEAGSRTGEDIEDVHIMRVTTRRMRSLLRLLQAYLKGKQIRNFSQDLRGLARALGHVRDLDVLIEDLTRYQGTLDDQEQTAIGISIAALDHSRNAARQELIELLDSKRYRRFIRDFSDYLIQDDLKVQMPDGNGVKPYQVRHVLPTLIYEHLAAVRAYDTALPDADLETLHALRIEFKRLRYAVSLFEDVLGDTIKDFITEIKTIQDHLGRLNDISTARLRLNDVFQHVEEDSVAALNQYVASLEAEEPELHTRFPAIWERFNSRKAQQKLATAVLALR